MKYVIIRQTQYPVTNTTISFKTNILNMFIYKINSLKKCKKTIKTTTKRYKEMLNCKQSVAEHVFHYI